MQEPIHTCRWPGCHKVRPRHLLMCSTHWRMLPKELRHAVWRSCKPRADLGTPSGAYLEAVEAALAWSKRHARRKAFTELSDGR